MKLFRATAAALLFGAATLAVAQTRTESFADQFKTMQSLQSFGTYTFKPPPTVSGKATDPVVKQSFDDSFTEMQALSSSSGEWNPQARQALSGVAAVPADPVGRESFDNMFSRMQAASSNSDEWKMPASSGAPAYGTASGTAVPSETGKPSLAQRIAHALNAMRGASSPSN
jgi:hypothetical protein